MSPKVLRLLGVLWGLLGVLKLLGPDAFYLHIETTYDVPQRTAHDIAHWLIGFELVMGCLLLFARGAVLRWSSYASLAISLGFGGYALLSGGGSCGCFGSVGSATVGRRLIVSGAMVSLAALGLLAVSESRSDNQKRALA